MTEYKCYQCGDEDLASVQAKRKAEIRAYADQVLAEAEAAREQSEYLPHQVADVELIEAPINEQPAQEFEKVEHPVADVLAATEEQEVPAIPEYQNPETVEEAPKAKKSTSKAGSTSK